MGQPLIYNQDRINFPSMYFGEACPSEEIISVKEKNKKWRFVFIGSFKKTKLRRKICKFLNQSIIPNGYPDLCQKKKVKKCPNIALAKYGFHLSGDSYGSS